MARRIEEERRIEERIEEGKEEGKEGREEMRKRKGGEKWKEDKIWKEERR